jgi:DNA transposition AAA+ family ATPase
MSNLTLEHKERIVEAIRDHGFRYKSNRAQATSLDVNPAQFSRIINDDIGKVLSDDKWMLIARKYNVPQNPNVLQWQIARTKTFNFIEAQLDVCKDLSVSGMFCDIADIGKTFTAKYYVTQYRNAIYIDCSQTKSRTKLVRHISKEFGLDHDGRYTTVKDDLIQYMKTMRKPLIILDEFGDLEYPAFLEVKALWNATEYSCGWYVMGADGLKNKIDRNRRLKKVGFSEIFSRFGNRYQRITPENEHERKEFLKEQAAVVAKANKSKLTAQQMYARSLGSLRRVRLEIIKQNLNQTPQSDD